MKRALVFSGIAVAVALGLAGCNENGPAEANVTVDTLAAGAPPTGLGSSVNISLTNESWVTAAINGGNFISLGSLPQGVSASFKNCAPVQVNTPCTVSFSANHAAVGSYSVAVYSNNIKVASLPFVVQWPQIQPVGAMQVASGLLSHTYATGLMPNKLGQKFGPFGPGPVSPGSYNTLINASPYPLTIGQISVQGMPFGVNIVNDTCSHTAVPSGDVCSFALNTTSGLAQGTGSVIVPSNQFASGSVQFPLSQPWTYRSINFSVTQLVNDSANAVHYIFLGQGNSSSTLSFTNMASTMTLRGPSISISGADKEGVTETANTCTTALGQGHASCSMNIALSASPSSGTAQAMLKVHYGDHDQYYPIIWGSNDVAVVPNPSLSDGAYQAVYIHNFNTSGSVTLNPSVSQGFALADPIGQESSCGSTLEAGAGCTLWVQALPAAVGGSASGTLSVAQKTLSLHAQTYLYAGGWFTSTFDGNTVLNHIARWDGSQWQAMGAGTDYAVLSLGVDHNGALYMGGAYNEINNQMPVVGESVMTQSNLAMWDGVNWTPHFVYADGSPYVSGIGFDGSNHLYIGGMFTTVDQMPSDASDMISVAKFDGSSWSGLSGGLIEQNTPARLNTLAVAREGEVFAGGNLTEADNDNDAVEVDGGMASWDGSQWQVPESQLQWLDNNAIVNTLAVDSENHIYAGGLFDHVGDLSTYGIAKWNRTSWQALGKGMSRNGGLSPVMALTTNELDQLYAGGSFDTAGETAANAVALWDGSNWQALGEGVLRAGKPGTVDALEYDATSKALYVGGQFDTAGETSAANIAVWNADTHGWQNLGAGLNGTVMALAVGSELTISSELE